MKPLTVLRITLCTVVASLGGCPADLQDSTNFGDDGAQSSSALAASTPPGTIVTTDGTRSTPSAATPHTIIEGRADGGVAPTGNSAAAGDTQGEVDSAAGNTGNDTGSSSGSSGVGDNSSSAATPSALPVQGTGLSGDPAPVWDTVDFVATQFFAVAAVFSMFGELGSPELDLTPETIVEWGTCPHVRVANGVDEAERSSLISIEYNNGCEAQCVAGRLVVGFPGEIYRPYDWLDATYVTTNASIAGHVVTPYQVHPDFNSPRLTVVLAGDMTPTESGVTLAGPCDFGVGGIGRATGSLTLYVGRADVLTFATAALTLQGTAGQVQDASFDGVVVRPAAYGNFVPDAGTASFTVAESGGTHSVVVQFLADSPTSRTVNVSVDGGSPSPHVLPPDPL